MFYLDSIAVSARSTQSCICEVASRLSELTVTLSCRAGSLYGELARFIFRMLGFKTKAKEGQLQVPGQKPPVAPGQPRTSPLPGLPGAPTQHRSPHPTVGGGSNWDSVWAP